MKIESIVKFVREVYGTDEFIPLHEPIFSGKEKEYVTNTIDTTFVSSVGKYVNQFEDQVRAYTGAKRAIATVNGTAALHTALCLAGVKAGDMVITQALTFVATCNVLHHMGAEPVFVDVSKLSLGLCPIALSEYLEENARINADGRAESRETQQIISAAVPMHTFGHPVQLDEISKICEKWNIQLVEDAAESLGSLYKNRHTGTLSRFGALSFNGNKIITTGGGGMVLCKHEPDGVFAKHLTTTAKVPHDYEFFHDSAGFNYRMPNINAALGCAQMEKLSEFLRQKRMLAQEYEKFFCGSNFSFFAEPSYAKSNYWINAVICPDGEVRDRFLKESNALKVMARPVWTLMHRLPMFKNSKHGPLPVSEWLESCLVNIPSSPVFLSP